jgi:hypothetical protein
MMGLDLVILTALKGLILSPEKLFCLVLGISAIASPILDMKIKKRGKK